MESDLQLVRRAKQGDAEAFGELYRQVYRDMYRFALYTLKNPQDAQDIVSDTVVDAFATIGKLRTEEAFQGWIFKILSNKCRKKIRDYSKRTLELTEEILEQQESGELSEHAVIRSLFFTLAEEERMIIAMHLFLGYSSKEMAELLQMNENTLRSKQSRAIKKMVEQYWE